MDNEKVRNLSSLIGKNHSNIEGIVVLKNGVKAYQYDEVRNSHRTATHVASVTKSVLSALIGISIDKGYINSVEDKVLDYFPNYKLKRGEKTLQEITLRHLLTMTAPYKYKSEPYTKVYSSNDWTTSSLDLLGGKGKVGNFKYTTVGLQVLSGVLTSAANQSISRFAKNNLFKPLGIEISQDLRIANKKEYLSFLKNQLVGGWVVDPRGINTAGWGLSLSAMDMAKLGQLYLDKGRFKQQQVLSPKWIEESVAIHSNWGERSYGYLWWVINENKGIYAAIGDSGNIIYVSSRKQLVVAISSRFRPRADDRIELIKGYIEPIFK